ncbi:hypothetical protein AAMO2058_001515200, partial [Amorphochlora amoebiformis]
YIIGGIVDKTVKPGLTLSKAKTLGIRCAKLDLPDGFLEGEGNQRQVLNVDTVVSILLGYVESKHWQYAIQTALPARKRISNDPPSAQRDIHEQSS